MAETSTFPTTLDSFTTIPAGTTALGTVHVTTHEKVKAALEAIEANLGVGAHIDPTRFAFASVKERLDRGHLPCYNVGNAGMIPDDTSTAAASTNVAVILYVAAYLSSIGGGIIYIPNNKYYTNAAIPIPDDVSIIGESLNAELSATHTTGAVLQFVGTSSAVRRDRVQVANLKIGGASGGTNSRIGIQCQYAQKIDLAHVEFWSTAIALSGLDWWDSTLYDIRFDQCSTTDGTNTAAVYLEANSASSTDSNTLRFVNCTWENCFERDLYMVALGSGAKRPNKIRFYGCKWECGGSGFLKGDRLVISGVSYVTFTDCEWTIGEFYSGYTTPVNVVTVSGSRDVSFQNCRMEGAPVASSTVARFLYLNGSSSGNYHITVNGVGFFASTNNNPTVAAIEWAGTNDDSDDQNIAYSYIASGTPVLRVGAPSSPSENTVLTLGDLIALDAIFN